MAWTKLSRGGIFYQLIVGMLQMQISQCMNLKVTFCRGIANADTSLKYITNVRKDWRAPE